MTVPSRVPLAVTDGASAAAAAAAAAAQEGEEAEVEEGEADESSPNFSFPPFGHGAPVQCWATYSAAGGKSDFGFSDLEI